MSALITELSPNLGIEDLKYTVRRRPSDPDMHLGPKTVEALAPQYIDPDGLDDVHATSGIHVVRGGQPDPVESPVASPLQTTAEQPKPLISTATTGAKHKLMMPEVAMYGILGTLARAMGSPLGWAYSSLLPLYGGLGINLDKAEPKVFPTAYVALLGPSGAGKTVVMTRARQMLGIAQDAVHESPNSDGGLIETFRAGLEKKDPPGPVFGGCIVADEMREMMAKMGYKGSTLQQKLCQLWSTDTTSSALAKGVTSMRARVSLLGNLKVKDRDEFSTLFAAQTQDGFYNRMIFAPGPTDWEFDWDWEPPSPAQSFDMAHLGYPATLPRTYPRPLGPVSTPGSCFQQLRDWEAAHKANNINPGRLGEIALRTAVITASANGDVMVTSECMAAALAFADWQMAVRKIYAAGEAMNEDAQVTGLILDAFAELYEAEADGSPKKLGGRYIKVPGGWVNFRLLQQSKNWHKKYSASTVNRNVYALVKLGFLEQNYDKEAKSYTNHYWLVEG